MNECWTPPPVSFQEERVTQFSRSTFRILNQSEADIGGVLVEKSNSGQMKARVWDTMLLLLTRRPLLVNEETWLEMSLKRLIDS